MYKPSRKFDMLFWPLWLLFMIVLISFLLNGCDNESQFAPTIALETISPAPAPHYGIPSRTLLPYQTDTPSPFLPYQTFIAENTILPTQTFVNTQTFINLTETFTPIYLTETFTPVAIPISLSTRLTEASPCDKGTPIP